MIFIRAFFYRLPILVLGLVYAAVYFLRQPQVEDTLHDLARHPIPAISTLVVPSLYFSVAHLSFIARREAVSRWEDSVIVCLPLIFFTADLIRASSDFGLLYFLAMIVAIGIVIELVPFIQRRPLAISTGFFALSALGLVLAILFTTLDPIDFPRLLGPVAVLILGLGFISVAAAALQVNKWGGLTLLAVFCFSAFLDPPSYDVRLLPQSSSVSSYQLGHALGLWLSDRQDLDAYRKAQRPYPVLIATAAGGGIAATAASFSTLTSLAQYCPSFGQHLFSAVGVSGGSFGLALYSAWIHLQPQLTAAKPCIGTPAEVASGELSADHLAPALAALLFLETVNVVMPIRAINFDAAQALELSFASPDANTLAFLGEDIASSWAPDGTAPLLAFVATRVKTATPYVFSPAVPELPPADMEWLRQDPGPNPARVRVVTAAGISARFPWIAPSARFPINADKEPLLVDGGYYDNSGGLVGISVLKSLQDSANASVSCASSNAGASTGVTLPSYCSLSPTEPTGCRIIIETQFDHPVDWGVCDTPIFFGIVSMAGVAPDPPAARDIEDSNLLDPLLTLLNGQDSKQIAALDAFPQYMCRLPNCIGGAVDHGYYPMFMPMSALALPFGWNISEDALHRVASVAIQPDQCGVPPDPHEAPDAQAIAKARSEMGCQAKIVGQLFDIPEVPDSASPGPAN